MREKLAEAIRTHTTDAHWTPGGLADTVLDALMKPTPMMKSVAADYLNKLGITDGAYDLGHDLIAQVVQAAKEGK